MRVRIGDQWHKVGPDQPVMIELNEGDRRNIANMVPGARFYAVFDVSDKRSIEQKLAWMRGE